MLDPAQNHAFRDHYLEIPIDLSRVLFIATANQLGTIHPALLDRMEMISLSGYTEDEKVHIARMYLVPRQLEENGLTPEQLEITDAALRRVIIGIHARGRRADARAADRHHRAQGGGARGDRFAATPRASTRAQVPDYLGPPRFRSETAFRTSRPGVATGLAWTETGGDVLFIEAVAAARRQRAGHPDRSAGQRHAGVGARRALPHPAERARRSASRPRFLTKQDIHIHVPAGAIPKDGPSAGVTMATAIVSAARGVPVRSDVAMTGEITLSGLVLPVGGIREKTLAARRSASGRSSCRR